ncbi:MAG: DNA-processing protein DprA [Myxococcota bacterium]
MRQLRATDLEYPRAFLGLRRPPPVIEVEGALAEAGPRVAIVGTRRSTELGEEIAFGMARGLARAGVCVVSGGAIGIDRAAHLGALAGEGLTWAVLPSAVERPQPLRNRDLFRRMVERGGALLGEPGPSARFRYVARNRLVAALVELVVVVEAYPASGSTATAEAAKELGVPVAAVPWSVRDPAGEGCRALLVQGARCVCSAEDVLGVLGCDPARIRAAAQPEGLLLHLDVPQTAEALAERAGRSVAEILVELTELELSGAVVALPGARFRRG